MVATSHPNDLEACAQEMARGPFTHPLQCVTVTFLVGGYQSPWPQLIRLLGGDSRVFRCLDKGRAVHHRQYGSGSIPERLAGIQADGLNISRRSAVVPFDLATALTSMKLLLEYLQAGPTA